MKLPALFRDKNQAISPRKEKLGLLNVDQQIEIINSEKLTYKNAIAILKTLKSGNSLLQSEQFKDDTVDIKLDSMFEAIGEVGKFQLLLTCAIMVLSFISPFGKLLESYLIAYFAISSAISPLIFLRVFTEKLVGKTKKAIDKEYSKAKIIANSLVDNPLNFLKGKNLRIANIIEKWRYICEVKDTIYARAVIALDRLDTANSHILYQLERTTDPSKDSMKLAIKAKLTDSVEEIVINTFEAHVKVYGKQATNGLDQEFAVAANQTLELFHSKESAQTVLKTGRARMDRIIAIGNEALKANPRLVDSQGASLNALINIHLPRLIDTHANAARSSSIEDLDEVDANLDEAVELARQSIEEGVASLQSERMDQLLIEVQFLRLRRNQNTTLKSIDGGLKTKTGQN